MGLFSLIAPSSPVAPAPRSRPPSRAVVGHRSGRHRVLAWAREWSTRGTCTARPSGPREARRASCGSLLPVAGSLVLALSSDDLSRPLAAHVGGMEGAALVVAEQVRHPARDTAAHHPAT